MPSVIVLVLIGLWSTVLVPPLLQRRQVRVPRPAEVATPLSVPSSPAVTARPAATHRAIPSPVVVPRAARPSRMATVPPADESEGPTPGSETDHADPWMPRSAADAQRRRVMVIVVLGACAVVSLTAVPLVGPLALGGHVVVDLVLAAYGWMVHDRSQRARQRQQVVRPLASPRRPVPSFVVDERFLDRSRRAG